MNAYERLVLGANKLAVIGLGYVGMPLAFEFAKKVSTIGFDTNEKKVALYKSGIDVTNEIGSERLKCSSLVFTSDEELLKEASFFIVAVPTPIDISKQPDLTPLINASTIAGRNISKGSMVIFESTVYPGVTEEICIPTMERVSGMKCGADFKVGYSPERINPGDKIHTVTRIRKIVSGCDDEALDLAARVYELIVEAGVYRAESIKVAEAAKVIENSQRDINIAFINELSVIFHKLGIDTRAVLDAAATKWNFLKFTPGLVGGHCIGVDPYYLAYKSELIGYHPQIILSGRRINDSMGQYVAENTVKSIIRSGKPVSGSKVLIMGMTFKENVADIRNSKVNDIIKELEEYGLEVIVTDPIADRDEVWHEYGITLTDFEKAAMVDAIILAVAHKEYESISLEDLKKNFSDGKYILVDVKGMYRKNEAIKCGFTYWSL
ncbi:MAG: UDP-N-acetyl-D-galactosamine dehydrogenase [Clostridiales bacterium GWC2_40_7]|nr:MAG: UDP-N-acetyl-D-galactosamine dehydrogenase [Clostridiales bacterium GWC2_40_7]